MNRYAVHGIYLTNYDTELLLLINPATQTRNTATTATPHSPYVRCTDISPKDECGDDRSHKDPCLSPLLLTEFPNIHGYIALASNDSSHYRSGFLQFANSSHAKQTLPFIAENTRGITGIPEIVLHPYHVRTSFDARTVHNRVIHEEGFSYAIQHRAELNYFPLLYVTEKKIYSFVELAKADLFKEFSQTERETMEFTSSIVTNMSILLEKALDPDGIVVDGIRYTFTVDLRTGFYIAKNYKIPRLSNAIEIGTLNIYRQSIEGNFSPNSHLIVPFEYPTHLKKEIHGYLARMQGENQMESNLVNALNRLGSSFSRHYVFSKSHPDRYRVKYRLEQQFPRPELTPKTNRRRATRRQSSQLKRSSTFKYSTKIGI